MSPLRWTCKSLRQLTAELQARPRDQPYGRRRALEEAEIQPASESQDREGGDHRDRDEQFNLINTQFKAALAENQPKISVDTKKGNSSATSRTLAASGGRKANRKRCACMTF